MRLRERLRALIPTREQIHGNRWLAWLAPWLSDAKLWHWSRRGVAMGVALGVFFGLLIPVAQIPLSVATAIVLRANVPAATASTLVTNPVTFGPVYYAAYQLGAWVTGEPMPQTKTTLALPQYDDKAEVSFLQRIGALGKSLMIGLAIISTVSGLLVYLVITMFWRWRIMAKRRPGRAQGRRPNKEP